MTLPQIARAARENAGYTIEGAAPLLGISDRQLKRYEYGQSDIPQDMVFIMATVYQAPELIIFYRQERDIFEQQLGSINLNNVNPDLVAGLVKYSEELEEAGQAVQKIIRVALNLHVKDQDRDAVVGDLEQAIYDIKTAVTHTETKVLKLMGIDAGIEAHKRHVDKCRLREYLGKEKTASAAAI